jgi:hypothetical protein
MNAPPPAYENAVTQVGHGIDLNDPRPAREIFELPDGAFRDPEVPPKMRGVNTTELYKVVSGLAELLNAGGAAGEQQAREALLGEPVLAAALFQLLHESGHLVDLAASNGDAVTAPLYDLPAPSEPPQLPPHVRSWLGARRPPSAAA